MSIDRKEAQDCAQDTLMLSCGAEKEPAQEEKHPLRSKKNWGSVVSWEPNEAPREQ
jgi:hypothetical protein